MNKRGLSQVIIVLFIILFSLAAIAILWVFISKILTEQASEAEARSQFFNQQVNFLKIRIDSEDELKINVSIKTSSGTLKIDDEDMPVYSPDVDVVSVADLSGSMRDCQNINSSCSCWGTLHGLSMSPHCYSISSAYVDRCLSWCNGNLLDGLASSQNANKQLIDTIFQDLSGSRIGLVAYNDTVINAFSSELTDDGSYLKSIINLWQPIGGTCICCGLNEARNKLSGSSDDTLKTIIVMSDGEANGACAQQGVTGDLDGDGVSNTAGDDAVQSACDAYSAIPNLTIYSIGLGGQVNSQTMEAIANCGNGTYFSAYQIDDLVDVYQSLAEQIKQKSTAVDKLNYLKIVFYDSNGNTVIREITVPKPLETRGYEFDLNGENLVAPIIKMEIYPVIVSDSGKEIIGPLFSSWEKK